MPPPRPLARSAASLRDLPPLAAPHTEVPLPPLSDASPDAARSRAMEPGPGAGDLLGLGFPGREELPEPERPSTAVSEVGGSV